MSNAPQIYKAMQGVMKDVCAQGIGKDSQNKDQGFKFRGIEAAMNALAPLLVKHGIVCVPKHGKCQRFDRQTKSGGTLSFVTTESQFDLICVEDGSKVTVETLGEGMDSSDKSTNKAMSAAFKYALFQAFVVPTMAVESDWDDGGMTEAEAIAEHERWIADETNRLKCSAATIETLKQVWKEIKSRCEERQDREAAELLLKEYKRVAAQIADRQAEAQQ